MPRPRADHTMVLYEDLLYLVGGWRDTGEGRSLVSEIDRWGNTNCIFFYYFV